MAACHVPAGYPRRGLEGSRSPYRAVAWSARRRGMIAGRSGLELSSDMSYGRASSSSLFISSPRKIPSLPGMQERIVPMLPPQISLTAFSSGNSRASIDGSSEIAQTLFPAPLCRKRVTTCSAVCATFGAIGTDQRGSNHLKCASWLVKSCRRLEWESRNRQRSCRSFWMKALLSRAHVAGRVRSYRRV
jgi:hypothetical protein